VFWLDQIRSAFEFDNRYLTSDWKNPSFADLRNKSPFRGCPGLAGSDTDSAVVAWQGRGRRALLSEELEPWCLVIAVFRIANGHLPSLITMSVPQNRPA